MNTKHTETQTPRGKKNPSPPRYVKPQVEMYGCVEPSLTGSLPLPPAPP